MDASSSKTFKLAFWLLLFPHSTFVLTAGLRNELRFPGAPKDIRLAVIVSENEKILFSRKKIEPAINIALDKAKEMHFRFPFNLTFEYEDSGCDLAVGMNAAIELYIAYNIYAFFGPVCDFALAPIARQTRFWNIPLITVGAMAKDFSDDRHTTYKLTTRAGPVAFSKMVEALSDILLYHHWKKFLMVYEGEEDKNVFTHFCHLCAEAIHYDMKKPETYNPQPIKLEKDLNPEKLLLKVNKEFGGNGNIFLS